MTKSDPLSASTLPDKCTAPAPEQPPLVKWAVEEARATRKAAAAVLPRPGATPATGLLTSWEQEAELLRSMHIAATSFNGSSTQTTAAAAAAIATATTATANPSVHFAPPPPSTLPITYGLHSPSLAPNSQMHMASSPEPRLADVKKIVQDLDGLFSSRLAK